MNSRRQDTLVNSQWIIKVFIKYMISIKDENMPLIIFIKF